MRTFAPNLNRFAYDIEELKTYRKKALAFNSCYWIIGELDDMHKDEVNRSRFGVGFYSFKCIRLSPIPPIT